MDPGTGIEPASSGYKAVALPLSYPGIAGGSRFWLPVRRSRRLLGVFVRTPGNSQHGWATIMDAQNHASAATLMVVVLVVVVECFFMA